MAGEVSLYFEEISPSTIFSQKFPKKNGRFGAFLQAKNFENCCPERGTSRSFVYIIHFESDR